MFEGVLGDDKETENFFEAVQKGDTERVQELIKLNPMIVTEVNDQMRNCLHIACLKGNVQLV